MTTQEGPGRFYQCPKDRIRFSNPPSEKRIAAGAKSSLATRKLADTSTFPHNENQFGTKGIAEDTLPKKQPIVSNK